MKTDLIRVGLLFQGPDQVCFSAIYSSGTWKSNWKACTVPLVFFKQKTSLPSLKLKLNSLMFFDKCFFKGNVNYGNHKAFSPGLDLWTCIPWIIFIKSLEVEVIKMTCSATWMCWPPHFRSSNVSTHHHLKTYIWWNALDDRKRWIHGSHCHLVHLRAE